MTIQILDLPDGAKLSKITVEFDNGKPVISTQTTGSQQSDIPQAIDFSTLGDIQVSQEVVEKPEIPDIEKRTVKVAQNMQNLQI